MVIKILPEDEETTKKHAFQIAINTHRAVVDVKDIFRTVTNELSEEQLALIPLLIEKKINSVVKTAPSKLKGKYKKINYLENYNIPPTHS